MEESDGRSILSYAIDTSELTRRFGELTAVDRLDLKVESGQFFGFLGSNGAGKSTTSQMLTGLLSNNSDSAMILGVDLVDDPTQFTGYIGVVPEKRGKAYSMDLLLKATQILQDAGIWRISCDTDAENTPMQRAFEKAGYDYHETVWMYTLYL